ncbi:Maf family protein [Chlorobium sp. N1]|uniref:Maf family protein n=1 Tax=Chlorobium sp. N1 TaxID=2491138 RepID=UPI0010398DF2|nr:Maf family protein [Chlorobium sp. N1]TCD47502.1 septum formation protein Maf [Chlorobium sp. N1]
MRIPHLLLASQSPRRRELLSLMAVPFSAVGVDTPERFQAGLPLEENVMRIAAEKARAALLQHPDAAKEALILGADTVVAMDRRILGKPKDRNDAVAMLRRLQGRTHSVHTGFALLFGDRLQTEMATTRVTLNPMTDAEIMRYVETGGPMDKAGAYGIQDPVMACHVAAIEGCYYNVVGLPLSRLWQALETFSD